MIDNDKIRVVLNAEIDKKCAEIKRRRKRNTVYAVMLACFAVMPSIFILLNISIMHLIRTAAVAAVIVFFVKMSAVADEKPEELCYE